MDLGRGGERTFWENSRLIGHCLPEDAPLGTAPFLASALAASGFGTWQFDITTGLLDIDTAASALLGLKSVPRTGAPLDWIVEDDQARVRQTIRRAIASGVRHEVDYRIRTASGETRWFHSKALAAADHEGSNRYLAGIVYDITDRKAAEASLLERDRQQDAIVASLPGVAYRCSLQAPWKMAFIAGAVEALTGPTAEAFLEGRVDWLALVHTEDAAMVGEAVSVAVQNCTFFNIKIQDRPRGWRGPLGARTRTSGLLRRGHPAAPRWLYRRHPRSDGRSK